MEVVIVLLAVVGAMAVIGFVVRSARSTARVFRAANEFQATASEAMLAISETPADERRQFRAIAGWEQCRASIRTLSESEQRIAVETLRGRGFPIAEVGETIAAFIAEKEERGRTLDAELAPFVNPPAFQHLGPGDWLEQPGGSARRLT